MYLQTSILQSYAICTSNIHKGSFLISPYPPPKNRGLHCFNVQTIPMGTCTQFQPHTCKTDRDMREQTDRVTNYFMLCTLKAYYDTYNDTYRAETNIALYRHTIIIAQQLITPQRKVCLFFCVNLYLLVWIIHKHTSCDIYDRSFISTLPVISIIDHP